MAEIVRGEKSEVNSVFIFFTGRSRIIEEGNLIKSGKIYVELKE